MSYRFHGHASVDPARPRAWATCDRCGFNYNRVALRWQYEWAGTQQINLRILVCQPCYDRPQEQLRVITLPADPLPIADPRPENYVVDETDWRVTQAGDIRSTQDGKLRVDQSSATEAEQEIT